MAASGAGQVNPGSQRRLIVSVVGDSFLDASQMRPHDVAGDEETKARLAYEVGKGLVDAGYRVLTGGRGGVMAEALRGARASAGYREGDTIAVLPGEDPAGANPYADIVICTGLGHYRNGIVGRADAVVAVGGAEGTLQEITTAWMAERPVVVLTGISGDSSRVAGWRIGSRGPPDRLPIQGATSADEAVQLVQAALKCRAE